MLSSSHKTNPICIKPNQHQSTNFTKDLLEKQANLGKVTAIWLNFSIYEAKLYLSESYRFVIAGWPLIAIGCYSISSQDDILHWLLLIVQVVIQFNSMSLNNSVPPFVFHCFNSFRSNNRRANVYLAEFRVKFLSEFYLVS